MPSGPDSWSDGSRLATIESLLHRGTFAIDASPWAEVGDRIRLADGFRSHQPPLLAVLGVPISAALELLGWRLAPASVGGHYLALVLILVALPFALFVRALARRVSEEDPRFRWVAPALLLASFATPYATVLNHHLPAATSAGFGLLALRAGASGRAGFWLGLATGLDLFAAGFAAGALALECVSRPARGIALARGCAVPLGCAAGLQWLATGELAPGGLRTEAFAWPCSSFLFEPLTGSLPARSAAGTWEYALRGTVGNYGLFAYHPWLLLAAAGTIFGAARAASPDLRRTSRVALIGSIVAIALYALLSENQGGACFGVRWLVALVPALALHTDLVPLPSRTLLPKILLGLALAWSAFFAAVGATAPFSRWNPFVRHGEEAVRDRAEGRPAWLAQVHEAMRVRALGPRFDEVYLCREYELGLEARLRRLESDQDLPAVRAITRRLESGAPGDVVGRARAALAEARLLAHSGDAGAARRAARRGLALRPGEPRLLLLSAELAASALDWPAGAAIERAAITRLVEDGGPEPEPGWRARAKELIERGNTSRSGFDELPTRGAR